MHNKTSYNMGVRSNTPDYKRFFIKKNLTQIVFILGRSGSMAGLEDDTIDEDYKKRGK